VRKQTHDGRVLTHDEEIRAEQAISRMGGHMRVVREPDE
jgi:hypothetical protein